MIQQAISCTKPTTRLRLPVLVGVVALLLASGTNMADDSSPVKELLLEQTAELPQSGIRTIMRTITWPVGYTSTEHSHNGPGPRYVLQGTVKITENGVAAQYGTGEVFWYSAQYSHMAENVDSIPTTVLIVEILPQEQ